MAELKVSLYIFFVINVLLFFYGFFPISTPKNAENNEPPALVNNVKLNRNLYKTNISKTVLIVIDALRLDFVTPQYMPMTSRITHETGCFSQVKVKTPTVTLPRLKALMSGYLPQFIDIALNLGDSGAIHDSLIHSFVKAKKKVVFYGDNTWLRLFPTQFSRYEGTHSFFVRDFSEVDNNVTRNVDVEIQRDDWDVLILHYLGLDHIGHVYGPFSSLVPKKLQEMDTIIDRIHTELSKTYSLPLIVLTGDHGMKDSGGHGGSSFAETNVPLLIIGLQCENGSMDQTDIPVNLAVLHGIDIPSTSIGAIKKNLIHGPLEKYLYVLYYNLNRLSRKSKTCTKEFETAVQNHIQFLKKRQDSFGKQAAKMYEDCTKSIVENLIQSSIEQNIQLLKVSLGMMAVLLSWLSINIISKYRTSKIMWQNNTYFNFIVLNFLHPLTLISTSYIEEEHEFWYFAVGCAFIIACIECFKTYDTKNILNCLSLVVIFRFLRNMNSVGNISCWLRKENNAFNYQLLLLFSFVFLLIVLCNFSRSYPERIIIIAILSLVYICKESDVIWLGKIIWLVISTHFVFFRSSIISTWCLITVLLLKPCNIILIPFCLLSSLFFRTIMPHYSSLIFHTWLGNMLYFAQGHSNSLASVDISVGYVGLTEYNLIIVIMQVLCHTYAFPILCHLLAFNSFRQENHAKKMLWDIVFINKFYVMFVVCLVSFLNREHLFIWSVFAPKLFIETIHVCVLFSEYMMYYLYTCL